MLQVTLGESQSKVGNKFLVAIGVCLISLAGLGVANGSMSLYTVPISDALGVSRSVYAMYDSFAKVLGSVLSLLFSSIYKKIGAKGLALLAGLGYILQYLCMAFATNVYVIWVGGVCAGVGYTFAGALTIFAVLSPWFKEKTGTASGIAAAMSGVASAVGIKAFFSVWIQDLGYSKAALYEAAIITVMMVIAFILVKTSPDDPVAGKNRMVSDVKEKIFDIQYYKKMLTEPTSLIMILIFTIIGGIGNSFTLSLTTVPVARGFADAAAIGASVISLHYLCIIPGKIGIGWVRDKFGLAIIIPVLFSLEVISMIIAQWAPESWYGSVGVIHGFGTCISQLLPPFLLMQVFGKYYEAGMLGVCLAFSNLGRAIGVPGIHISYDANGSYAICYAIWIALWITAWLLSYVALSRGKKYVAKRDAAEGPKLQPAA